MMIWESISHKSASVPLGNHGLGFHRSGLRVCCRSPKVGNPVASILKSTVEGIPALFGLNPVSNFMGFTINPKP